MNSEREGRNGYICRDVQAEVGGVDERLLLGHGDIRVLQEFVEVLVGDA